MGSKNSSQILPIGSSGRGQQKYKQRLEEALRVAAHLVQRNFAYIPVFERLEKEIANIEQQYDVIERAQLLSG